MAENKKNIELLSTVELLSALDKASLATLAEHAKSESHEAGAVVFRVGDAGNTLYVVRTGQYEVVTWDEPLKIERHLALCGKGDVFGEMGMLTGEPRSAQVRARQAGETLSLERKTVLAQLEKQPKAALALARLLIKRLRATNKAGGPRFDKIGDKTLTREIVSLIPLQVILRHQVLPIARTEHHVTVAMVDPGDLVARNTANEFLGKYVVEWVAVSQADFEQFRDTKLFDLIQETTADAAAEDARHIKYVTLQGLADVDTSPAAKSLDDLLKLAVDSGAGDVHLEPTPDGANVRGRIDGRLVELASALTATMYKAIVSRIKVLSDLNITETRQPQDAVLHISYGGRNIDLRVSTLPTPRGEAVAFRVFDPRQRQLEIRTLASVQATAEMMESLFLMTAGLVLVTGPTCSGKTTTLYSGIRGRLERRPTDKLITVEDPVEYLLAGTTQVQVQPQLGQTFDLILRSALRQSPDCILVGEIRDKASTEIAFEAAMAGQLVLSSLPTNDVFETVLRLRQRGLDSFIIASALRGIVSQRLIPRLCPACIKPQPLDAPAIERLRQSGLADAGKTPKAFASTGCPQCRKTGYQGRLALFEVLEITPSLRDAIEKGASAAEMLRLTTPACFRSMRAYALNVMEQGLVSVKDVLEVFHGAACGIGAGK